MVKFLHTPIKTFKKIFLTRPKISSKLVLTVCFLFSSFVLLSLNVNFYARSYVQKFIYIYKNPLFLCWNSGSCNINV